MAVRPFNPGRLLGARLARDMTRDEACNLMKNIGFDVSTGTLQNWERGWYRMPAAALPYVARVYRCKMEAFYGPDRTAH
jgi:hypothetical protein